MYRLDSDTALKVFHEHRRSPDLHDKLKAMLDCRPSGNEVAWIKEIVYDGQGRVAGFTMPWVDPRVFAEAHLYYDPADRRARFGETFTWQHLLKSAEHLAVAVRTVHQAGHRVGDLRETNVMIAPDGRVILIDCDSFQIADKRTMAVYPTRVATGDYLAPELQGRDFVSDPTDRLHGDRFALAVLIFRLLMNGAHPYAATGPAVDHLPTTESKIREGRFPYSRVAVGISPPAYAPDYNTVPSGVRKLFRRAFVTGHSHPERRPTAAEWADALARESDRVRTCRKNSNHRYSSSTRGCPACREQRRPRARTSGSNRQPAQWARVAKERVAAEVPAPIVSLCAASAAAGAGVAPVPALAALIGIVIPTLATASTTNRTWASVATVPFRWLRMLHLSASRAAYLLLPILVTHFILERLAGIDLGTWLAGVSAAVVVLDVGRSTLPHCASVRTSGVNNLLGVRTTTLTIAAFGCLALLALALGIRINWP